MFFVLLNFLKRRLRVLIIFFASFDNQEGSDCLILTFLLEMCLSASYEIRLVIFDAYMPISHYSSVIPIQFPECHEIEIGSHHDQIT